ncbi:MAG TPA: glycosyltransferase [Rhodopila sp.]|nr:glycosyltransferase [Rhodopila sp.]
MVHFPSMNILTRDSSTSSSAPPGTAPLSPLHIGSEIDWQPDHLVQSAWLEHLPFAFWLIKVHRPSCLVELGVERGASYAAFCQAVERFGVPARCFGVDTWRGDDHAGHYDESVYATITAAHARYQGFSNLIRTTFADAAGHFCDGEIDLLHIDGLHTYEAVSGDFATWCGKLSARGVVLFHDTNVRRDDFGVWRFWEEIRPHYPHFEFVHGHGLGVLGVGTDLPGPLRTLFEADADEDLRAAIRSLFAARGSAVQSRFQLDFAHAELADLSAQVTALRQANEKLRNEAGRAAEEQAAAYARTRALEAERSAAAEQLERRLAAATAEANVLRHALARQRNELQHNLARHVGEIRSIIAASLDDRQARAAREQDLQSRLAQAQERCTALLDSTSWRITAPLRALSIMMSQPRRAAGTVLRDARLHKARDLMRSFARRQPAPAAPAVAALPRPERVPQPTPQSLGMQLRVLIVAEMSLPQCRKYRVDQKAEMIHSLGFDCTTVSWTDTEAAITLLQTHSVAIFYRVPAFPDLLRILDEANRLGVPHYFEVDDLIFDISDYANPNLVRLSTADAEGLFEGAILYRQALVKCRNVIASTGYLAGRMQALGGGRAFVVENALDAETLRIAEATRRREPDGKVRIVYGSGTRTHDADFALVAPVLRRVLRENPEVELLLIGELTPPRAILALGSQVTQMESRPYTEYLDILAESDVAIAPLMHVSFNEAKSNIKFLEAAAVGVPSVCSARSAFTTAIRHGETGFIADTEAEWYHALTNLVRDPTLRARIGAAARKDVLDRYSPAAVARRELTPLLETHKSTPGGRLHIMEVNLLFRPQSYGGATIVAEAMVDHLRTRSDTRFSVVTTSPAGWLKTYSIERSEEDGVTIFRLGLQDRPGWASDTWNETIAESFRHILRAQRPDVVHFHAMQGLGAACLRVCHEEGIPYVVTAHDAWWVCARQFLVKEDGRYCGQHKIDFDVCATCVPHIGAAALRNTRLRHALQDAALLLTPTRHWREFYIANGFPADRVAVNGNGIDLPANAKPNEAPERLRFGFVAGTHPVKGFPILKQAFEQLPRDDWELILINQDLLIGRDSFADVQWQVRGTIRTIPPFEPADRDAFYDQIHVLLFPSQWPESFGLTVREALARNKWVIATDRGGAAEAITPGVNGTLIPIGDDPAPFVKAVQDLLDRKPDLRGWVNPHRDQLRDFATQAAELREMLAAVASAARTADQFETV